VQTWVGYDFALVALAIVVGLLVWWGLNRTRQGKIMLAVIHSAAVAADDGPVADRLAMWQLIGTLGPGELAKVRALHDGPDFLTWLGRHPRVVEDYLSSGDPREYNAGGLGVWEEIRRSPQTMGPAESMDWPAAFLDSRCAR